MPWLTGLPGYLCYSERANFLYVSLENKLKSLQAKQGSQPTRGTLCTCPLHPARRYNFSPCKRFVPGYIPYSKMAAILVFFSLLAK